VPSGAESCIGVQKPAERKAAPMSADNLKRKLRNFPVSSLSQRIAAAS
jgi:hypothetical protein